MIRFQIARKGTEFFLQQRNYVAQGIRPFYARLCSLSEAEAAALHASGLVRLADAREAPAVTELQPSDLLKLSASSQGLEITLLLPANAFRPTAFEGCLPGFEEMLRLAATDELKCRKLLENTRTTDARTEST